MSPLFYGLFLVLALVTISFFGTTIGVSISVFILPFFVQFLPDFAMIPWTLLLWFLPYKTWPIGLVISGFFLAKKSSVWSSKSETPDQLALKFTGICEDALANLSQMVFVYEQNKRTGKGKVLYLSPRCTEILGMSSEVGMRENGSDIFRSRIHPEDVSRHLADVAFATTTNTGLQSEVRILGKDNKYHWIRMRSKVKLNTKSTLTWFGITDDITDLVEARSQLSEEQSMVKTLESVLSVTFDATVFINADFKITNDSPKLRHFFGQPNEPISNKNFRDLLGSSEDKKTCEKCLVKSIDGTGAPAIFKVKIRIGDQGSCAAELYCASLTAPLEESRLIGLRVLDTAACEELHMGAVTPSTQTGQEVFFERTQDRAVSESSENGYFEDEEPERLPINVDISGNFFALSSALASGLEESARDAFLAAVPVDLRKAAGFLSQSKWGNINPFSPTNLHLVDQRAVRIVFKLIALGAVEFSHDPIESLSILTSASEATNEIQDDQTKFESRLFVCLAGCQLSVAHPELFPKRGDSNAWLSDLFSTVLKAVQDETMRQRPDRGIWNSLLCMQWGIVKFRKGLYDEADYWLEQAIENLRDNTPKSLQLRVVALYNLILVKQILIPGGGQQLEERMRRIVSAYPQLRFHHVCVRYLNRTHD